MRFKIKYCLIVFLLSIPLITSAQISLVGITQDSATHNALSFVTISVNKKVTTVSGEHGLFEVICNAGDTISFSQVGYKASILVPLKSDRNFVVFMSESTTVLNSITIYGDYKPQGKSEWRRYIIAPTPFDNITMKDPSTMVQTFGPSASFPGVLSYFNSENREKRKVVKAEKEQSATAVFREVMSSDVVKQDLMKLFSLTEEQYLKKIEAFNVQNPDAAYLKSRDEIINHIIGFFALKEK